VCVVNEAFAKFFFGKRNPIGKHVTDEFPDTRMTFQIVGVSGNARDHTLRGDVPRRFYIPIFHPLGDYPAAANFEIRTDARAESLLPIVRRRIQEIDDALPILSARTLADLVDQRVAQERLIAEVSGFFGVFGATYLVFVTQLGFSPGAIGLIAAIGGASSLIGALVAARGVERLGVGRFLIGAMALVTVGNAAIAFAPDASPVGLGFLLTQQLVSDSAFTGFAIIDVSIRQTTVDDRTLGRVSASFNVLAMAAMLVGTLAGGIVATVWGLRTAILLGSGGGVLGLAIVATSRVRSLREMPLAAPAAPVMPGVDVPLTE
jgi:hypothetical protein